MKDGRSDKTFFIRTPADLLEKLRWEIGILLDSAPFDLHQRAYMVMNCAITAWQMKDWVYNTLDAASRLKVLDDYAKRHIKSREDFGVYLKEANPYMRMAHQIATASKHLQIEERGNEPDIKTAVESVEIELRGGYQRDDLFIVDKHESILVHELINRLYLKWKEVLHALSLIPVEQPFVDDGDRPLPVGTPRLRRKRLEGVISPMDEKAALEKARGLSDLELHMSVNSKIQMSEGHIAAKLELERRERKHRFWRQDLVAWLALGLAIISLIVSALTWHLPYIPHRGRRPSLDNESLVQIQQTVNAAAEFVRIGTFYFWS